MATMIAARPKLRADDIFFPAMAVLILGIVVTGFAQSYFLAGMVRAKLPNALVHVHGAAFISWILLLLAQNTLVAARKIKWHIRLGILGFVLPPLMVVLGTLTLFDSIRRAQLGIPPELLLVADMEQLVLFAILVSWAMLARRNPASHKRLMILGTIAILAPAIDRWHFGLPVTIGVTLALPLIVVVYDLLARGRIHRSTAIGCILIESVILTSVPLAQLPIWSHCVAWIRHS